MIFIKKIIMPGSFKELITEILKLSEEDNRYKEIIDQMFIPNSYSNDFSEKLSDKYVKDMFNSANKIIKLKNSNDIFKSKAKSFSIKTIFHKNNKNDLNNNYYLIDNILNNNILLNILSDKRYEDIFAFDDLSKKDYAFLSYAVSDLKIAISLFLFYRLHGKYLYVDYIVNNKLSGIQIPNTLGKAILQSKYILFVDTNKSIFKFNKNFKSNSYIRPWCSWEIGTYLNTSNIKNYRNFYKLGWYSYPYNNKNFQLKEIMNNIHYI